MAGSQSRHDSGATQWGRLTSAQPASSAPAPAQSALGTSSGTSPKRHPSDSTTRWATGPRRAGPCAPALDTDQRSSIRGHPDSARPRSVTKPARDAKAARHCHARLLDDRAPSMGYKVHGIHAQATVRSHMQPSGGAPTGGSPHP